MTGQQGTRAEAGKMKSMEAEGVKTVQVWTPLHVQRQDQQRAGEPSHRVRVAKTLECIDSCPWYHECTQDTRQHYCSFSGALSGEKAKARPQLHPASNYRTTPRQILQACGKRSGFHGSPECWGACEGGPALLRRSPTQKRGSLLISPSEKPTLGSQGRLPQEQDSLGGSCYPL